MKRFFIIRLILLSKILFLFFIVSNAQDKKIHFIINGQFSHFIGKGKQSNDNFLNKYNVPLNPGIELLSELKLGKDISVLSGADYYWSRFTTTDANGVENRARLSEFSLPLLLRKGIKQQYFITAGFYPGWLNKGHIENYNRGEGEWYNISRLSDRYNDERFILDFYIDFGKYQPVFENQVILISPFIKYKINDYWAGQFRSKIHYGIKFGYNLNF